MHPSDDTSVSQRVISNYGISNGILIKGHNIEASYTSNDGDVYEGDTVKTCTYMVNNIQKAYTANYFDTFKRLSTKETKLNQNNFIKNFTYNGSRISKMEDTVLNMKLGTNNYSYDSMGRIVSNTYSSKNTTSNYRTYMYDQYGQLIRENNEGLDKTFVYEYDSIGNIISVKEYDFTLSNTPSGTCTEKSYTYNTTYNYDNSGRLLREYCTEKYISGTTTTKEFVYLYDESSTAVASSIMGGWRHLHFQFPAL